MNLRDLGMPVALVAVALLIVLGIAAASAATKKVEPGTLATFHLGPPSLTPSAIPAPSLIPVATSVHPECNGTGFHDTDEADDRAGSDRGDCRSALTPTSTSAPTPSPQQTATASPAPTRRPQPR